MGWGPESSWFRHVFSSLCVDTVALPGFDCCCLGLWRLFLDADTTSTLICVMRRCVWYDGDHTEVFPPPILKQHSGVAAAGVCVCMAGNNHSYWCWTCNGVGARHHSKLFKCTDALHSQNNPTRYKYYSDFTDEETWGPEMSINLSEVMQLINGRARIQTQAAWLICL